MTSFNTLRLIPVYVKEFPPYSDVTCAKIIPQVWHPQNIPRWFHIVFWGDKRIRKVFNYEYFWWRTRPSHFDVNKSMRNPILFLKCVDIIIIKTYQKKYENFCIFLIFFCMCFVKQILSWLKSITRGILLAFQNGTNSFRRNLWNECIFFILFCFLCAPPKRSLRVPVWEPFLY